MPDTVARLTVMGNIDVVDIVTVCVVGVFTVTLPKLKLVGFTLS